MKKILTIDGGGIKGILSASFLAEIEERCKIQICDYFDMIAGTSTGGIIAAALAVGIPARTIVNTYMEKGNRIFPKYSTWSLFRAKYNTGPLETALTEVFGDKCIKECKTRLVIPAFNLETSKTRVFKTTHSARLFFDQNLSVVDCLLATTAAPLYFSPHRMEGGRYIDGGVGANNPSLIALIEGIAQCGWNKDEILLLSVGNISGIGFTVGNERMGVLDALKIQKCFMSAESQYSHNICNLMLPQQHYIRIDYDNIREMSMDRAGKETMVKLKDLGEQAAMENINIIKNIFFDKEKEEVEFFNL